MKNTFVCNYLSCKCYKAIEAVSNPRLSYFGIFFLLIAKNLRGSKKIKVM